MVRIAVVGAALAGLIACGCGNKAGGGTTGPTPGPGSDAGVSAATADAGPTLDELRIAAIQKAVNETKAQRHHCWARASGNTMVAGTVTLKLKFKKMAVAAVSVAKDTSGSEKLGDCLMALYKSYAWQPVFTDDAAIQLPFQFLKAKSQFTVHTDDVKVNVLAGTDLRVKVLLHEANTGNTAAALSTLEITDGLKVPMHKHSSAELLYFEQGGGTLRAPGRVIKVKAGMAVYIPAGVPHEFVHAAKIPAKALQLYVPGGPEQRFRGGPPTGTTKVSGRDFKLASRRVKPYAVVGSRAKQYGLPGKAGAVTIVLDGLKNKNASFQMMTLNPGAAVPKHKHPTATEIIHMIRGEGVVTVAGTDYPVRAGHSIQIPAGVDHAFKVGAKASVQAYQFYVPGGPEQRFKKTK